MYKTKVVIEGIVPIKFNAPIEAVAGLTEFVKEPKAGQTKELLVSWGKGKIDYFKKDGWKLKVRKDEKGYWFVADGVEETIIKGLSSPVPFVVNKVKLFKTKCEAALFMDNDRCYFKGEINKEPERYITYNRAGMNTSMVFGQRPVMEKWEMEFVLNIVQDYIPIDILEEGITRAGICHGMGSHRPKFGRFKLKSIKKIK